ncbi:Acyl-coenzyme A thioesterase 9, mitochondrial [Sciurus carolinensis]|uniref:Acyl-coenzyme A thioesterase 9, mitochondrial n=1 Tax=Sciurus carolinensis TaxID=30640 RepID=A0AA41NCN7_SCICA|nr:Acyl-coenzyme A thioesterase 9, mitochondrial [Sciurus carolinensis]
MEERKLLHSFLAKSQEELPPRRMKDSYIEVLLPLGSEPELREKYLTVQNTVRFGRILEDLDSLGVLVCYMHTKNDSSKMSPLSIVTALVDKIVNKGRRIAFSSTSLLKMAPSAEERTTIHEMFLSTLDPNGSRPFVVAVDDIMFQKPVDVGSLLFLSSQVCFTQNNYIQVRVHSEVASLQKKEHMTTNVFHFTFMSEKEVPLVYPKTYGGKQ